jgi:hypothetical protein
MASSGITSYSVTETDILTDAYENAAIYGSGETIGAEDVVLARRKLNLIVKQWTAQIDFAPGLKMWCRRRAYLFLQKSQIQYSMGPTGDNIAEGSYFTSTTTVNAALGAGTVTLASVTGLATGMYIGILLSTGSIQWTTINGTPVGLVVTLTATLTASAASGSRVFAYTTKARRPFDLATAVLRDTTGNDVEMQSNLLLEAYEAIPTKSVEGTPTAIYMEAQRTNVQLYLDCAPADRTQVIRLVYRSYVEDSTALTDDIDFPAEWYRPLSAQLAIDLCPAFRRAVTPEMKLMRDEALKIAQNAYPATTTAGYEPDPDCY